jgi:DNA-directed RNA polymerase I, II, and III subunit RPABC2
MLTQDEEQEEDEDEVDGEVEGVEDELDDGEEEDLEQVMDNESLISDDSEEEEENDYDYEDVDMDNRIDDEFKMKYIQMIHPEEVHDQIDKMNASTILKKQHNIDDTHSIPNLIEDSDHSSYPFLTKYERARVLGLRISQLNEGARPFVRLQHKIIDNHIIAEKELNEKKLPFIVMRPMPNGKKEYWRLEDLEIIER